MRRRPLCSAQGVSLWGAIMRSRPGTDYSGERDSGEGSGSEVGRRASDTGERRANGVWGGRTGVWHREEKKELRSEI